MNALRRIFREYIARHHRDHGRREVVASLAIAVLLAAGALVGVAWAAGFGEVASGSPHWIWFLVWLPVIPGTPGLLVLKRRYAGSG